MSLFSPRSILGSLGLSRDNDLESAASGVVGSFSSGGCCDNGVDTAAWLALLVGKNDRMPCQCFSKRVKL